jgi:DNA-binding LacI/PurR family transcriptional regulator
MMFGDFMVTIYDIAKTLQMAPSTISKVLNNYSGVNSETKRKVLKAASDMGYRPNTAARSLKTKRSYNIGVITYIQGKADLTHYLFMSILNEFKTVMDGHGYDLTIISRETERSFSDHCKMRGVDGVLIFGDCGRDSILKIIDGGTPAVGFDYSGKKMTGVCSDNAEKTRELVEHLVSFGHRRIKFFYGSDNFVTRERTAAFRGALSEFGIEFEDFFMTRTEYVDPLKAEKATNEFLDGPRGCTAIIYPDDYSALGGLRALQKRGESVPGDYSVASFDGIELSEITNPPLTTVKQNAALIAGALASKLLEHIEGSGRIEKVVVPARLVKTASVGPAKL